MFFHSAPSQLSLTPLGPFFPAPVSLEHSLLTSEIGTLLVLLRCLKFSQPSGLLLLLPSLPVLPANVLKIPIPYHQSPLLSKFFCALWFLSTVSGCRTRFLGSTEDCVLPRMFSLHLPHVLFLLFSLASLMPSSPVTVCCFLEKQDACPFKFKKN